MILIAYSKSFGYVITLISYILFCVSSVYLCYDNFIIFIKLIR